MIKQEVIKTMSDAEAYNLAVADGGRTPYTMLAKRAGHRGPNFIMSVTRHAQLNELAVPMFCWLREARKDTMTVSRIATTKDVRVSSHILASAGLASVLHFNIQVMDGSIVIQGQQD